MDTGVAAPTTRKFTPRNSLRKGPRTQGVRTGAERGVSRKCERPPARVLLTRDSGQVSWKGFFRRSHTARAERTELPRVPAPLMPDPVGSWRVPCRRTLVCGFCDGPPRVTPEAPPPTAEAEKILATHEARRSGPKNMKAHASPGFHAGHPEHGVNAPVEAGLNRRLAGPRAVFSLR